MLKFVHQLQVFKDFKNLSVNVLLLLCCVCIGQAKKVHLAFGGLLVRVHHETEIGSFPI